MELLLQITAPTGYNLYYLKLNGVSLMDPVASSNGNLIHSTLTSTQLVDKKVIGK